MTFTTGFIKPVSSGFISGFTGVQAVNDLIAVATGQSLQNRLFTDYSGAGNTAFLAAAPTYFSGTVTHIDAASDNQYLTKSSYDASGDTGGRYYWDDTTDSKGLTYIANLDPISNKDIVNLVKIDLGQSDGVNTSFPHTQAAYQGFWLDFIDQIRSDFPNALIMINVLNRTVLSGDFDTTYNLVRETQLNLPSQRVFVYRGIDSYDLTMTDNFHFVQAGVEEYAEREVRRIAEIYGKTAPDTLGPSISNLQLNTDRISFDINHDDGNDWTAPSSGAGQFVVKDDGTGVIMDDVTRTNATSGVIIFPEGQAPLVGSTVTGFVNYGDGGALGSTPDVALDNNSMPFRSLKDIAVSNADPVADLDNVDFYIDARGSAKTYSSGNIVDTVTALEGIDFEVLGVDTGPEFTDDYIEFSRTTDRLITSADFANSNTFTLGFCGILPDTIPSFSILGNFAASNGATTNFSRLITQSGGTIAFQASNPSNQLVNLATGLSGGTGFIIFLRLNSLTSCDGFVNTKTSPVNFDPRDDYSVQERWSFGDSQNQTPFAMAQKLHRGFLTSDAISDTELGNIYDDWNTRFNLGL